MKRAYVCLLCMSSIVQAALFDTEYTPQSYVSDTQRVDPISRPQKQQGSFKPQYWIESNSVLTYAHEAAMLLLNQDYRYLTSQKLAMSHYFHPDAFDVTFAKDQQALQQVMLKEHMHTKAYALQSPELDPTFAPKSGEWQVILPMHQRIMKEQKVVVEQDLALRMLINMRRKEDYSSWQIVSVDVKPMDKDHAQPR